MNHDTHRTCAHGFISYAHTCAHSVGGWQIPESMSNLKLTAKTSASLLKIRAMYIMQLLVTLVSQTSNNLNAIFHQFESSTMREKLALMDSCLLSYEAFTAVWQMAIKDLLVNATLDVPNVLNSCNVTIVTGTGTSSGLDVGDGKNPDANGGDDDGERVQDSFFKWFDLLNFGFDDGLLSADTLRCIELEIEKAILNHSSKSMKQWHQNLVVHVAHDDPTSTGTRAQKKHEGEVLLLFDPTESEERILRFANLPSKIMYRLPKELKLYFTGTVGSLYEIYFIFMRRVCSF